MTRLLGMLRCDVIIQFRNGFYAVSAVFILVWVGLFRQLPAGFLDYALVVPAFVALNLVPIFYFIAALVLLEKSEGMLAGLVVTPLRPREFLLAKTVSLTLLGVVEGGLIVAFLPTLVVQPLPLLLGMCFIASFYTLIGFAVIVRFDSINAYILPAGFVVFVLVLPLAAYFGLWQSRLFALHPLQPMLVLLDAAFVPTSGTELIYGLGGSLLWIWLSFAWAKRAFRQFIARTTGGA